MIGRLSNMPTLQDLQRIAFNTAGYNSVDLPSAWMEWAVDHGATSTNLPDAINEVLQDDSTTSTQTMDLWAERLSALGYTGSLPDMLYGFWSDGGTFVQAEISLLFSSEDSAYTYPTRASTAYCEVYKDTGETRWALLPIDEAPRHGWRQWENLCLRSDEFNISSWTLDPGSSRTANTTIAPDGTMTADTLSIGSLSLGVYQQISTTPGHTYTWSIFVYGAVGEIINVGANAGTGVDYAQITLTGEWQRVTGTLIATITAANFHFRSDYPVPDGVVGAFEVVAWGAQFEDQTSLPAADQGIPNEYVTTGASTAIGWSRYTNKDTVVDNVVIDGGTGDLIPNASAGQVDGYSPMGDGLETNGTFDTDADWVKVGTATISGGVANLLASDDEILQVQSVATKVCLVTFDAVFGTATYFKIYTGGAYKQILADGAVSFIITAGALDNFRIIAGNGSATVDNVTVHTAHPTRRDFWQEPERTNEITYPRDFSSWTQSNSPTIVKDQIGFDGIPDSASSITDSSTSFTGVIISSTVINDSATHSGSIKLLKDSDETRFPELQLRLTGGSAVNSFVQFNTKTGATNARVGTPNITVTSDGDFWNLIIDIDNNSSGNTLLSVYFYPSMSTVFGTQDANATGTVIADQAELHLNTTISQLKYASPIPNVAGTSVTKSADLFADATLGAKFPQAGGACLAKWTPSWDAADLTGDVEIASMTTAAGLLYHDETNNTIESADGTNTATTALTTVALTEYDVASYWGTGLGVVVDTTAGTEQSFDGAFTNDGTLRLGYAQTHPHGFSSVIIYKPQPSVDWIKAKQ